MPQLQLAGPQIRDLRRVLPYRDTYQRRPLDLIAGVVIHHTGGSHLDWTAEAIARYHTAEPPQGLGWPGIGYHFLVHWDGAIDWCNDLEAVSYHADGQQRIAGVGINNWQYVAICLTGDFMQGRRPSVWQLLAARYLVDVLSWQLGRKLPVLGHCDLTPTLCPGEGWAEWSAALR